MPRRILSCGISSHGIRLSVEEPEKAPFPKGREASCQKIWAILILPTKPSESWDPQGPYGKTVDPPSARDADKSFRMYNFPLTQSLPTLSPGYLRDPQLVVWIPKVCFTVTVLHGV